jgi:solute carrier family 35 protein E1
MGTSQLVVGLFYAFPLMFLGIRKFPSMKLKDIVTLLPIILLNTCGHISALYAMMQKGGGSFTHVIKASEPVVSVILGLFINGIVPKPLTALSLLPITYGVAYASTLGDLSIEKMSKELLTLTAILAMTSNISFAFRSVFRKKLTSEFKKSTGLEDPTTEHCVTTALSSIILGFATLYSEPVDEILKQYNNINDKNQFIFNCIVCGMSFYLYNEIQNIVLDLIGAVPMAVGNTLKRVAIFAALYVFIPGETFPEAKIFGCAIAIVGCLLYAVFDAKKI